MSDKNISILDAFGPPVRAPVRCAGRDGPHLPQRPSTSISTCDHHPQGCGHRTVRHRAGKGEDRAARPPSSPSAPRCSRSIEGGMLIDVAGPTDVGLGEVGDAVELIHKNVHPQAQIIQGTHPRCSYGDDVRVTVIAAGLIRTRRRGQTGSACRQALVSDGTSSSPASRAAPPIPNRCANRPLGAAGPGAQPARPLGLLRQADAGPRLQAYRTARRAIPRNRTVPGSSPGTGPHRTAAAAGPSGSGDGQHRHPALPSGLIRRTAQR